MNCPFQGATAHSGACRAASLLILFWLPVGVAERNRGVDDALETVDSHLERAPTPGPHVLGVRSPSPEPTRIANDEEEHGLDNGWYDDARNVRKDAEARGVDEGQDPIHLIGEALARVNASAHQSLEIEVAVKKIVDRVRENVTEHVHQEDLEDEHQAITTAIELTSGGLLIGFVVLNMIILRFTNHRIARVKTASLQILCVAFGVFCAVLIEHGHMNLYTYGVSHLAKHTVVYKHIGKCSAKLFLKLPLYFLWVVLSSVLCYKARGDHHALYCTCLLVTHIAAFVSIHIFRDFAECQTYSDHGKFHGDSQDVYFKSLPLYAYFMTIVLCYGAMTLASRTMKYLSRRYLVCGDGHDENAEVTAETAADHGTSACEHTQTRHCHWLEELRQEQSETAALVVGFLVKNYISTSMILSAPSDRTKGINMLVAISVLYFFSALFFNCVDFFERSDSPEFVMRLANTGFHIFLMALAWFTMACMRYSMAIFSIYEDIQYTACCAVLVPSCGFALLVAARLEEHGVVSPRLSKHIISVSALTVGFSWEKAASEAMQHVIRLVYCKFGPGQVGALSEIWRGCHGHGLELTLMTSAVCLALVCLVAPAWWNIIAPLFLKEGMPQEEKVLSES